MKTLKALSLIALLLTLASCSGSSSSNSKPAQPKDPLAQTSPVLKLNNNEAPVGSAIATLNPSYVTVIFSYNNSLTCESLKNASVSLPTDNYATLGFPQKVADYGTLGVIGLAQQSVVLGFVLTTGNAQPAAQMKLNVKEITQDSVTLDIDATSQAQTESIKGSFKIPVCN